MTTSFRPSLNTLEARLNLSAEPLPVLLVIADQRDFGPPNESDLDFVAARANPAPNIRRGQWIMDTSIIVTGQSASARHATHVDFLWSPTGRTTADTGDYAQWRVRFGSTLPAAPADGDNVLKGATIDVNAPRHHGTLTIRKEWDAVVPHGAAVGQNETISIGIGRMETVTPPAGR